MQLNDAQITAWGQQQPPPQTTQEALGRLHETVQNCLKAFQGDQLVHTQAHLEDTLLQTLVAMRSLGLEADRGLMRALARGKQSVEQRFFLIFPDRVEIRVAGEYRGGWPLYTQDDYAATLQVARDLRCEVQHTDAQQLDLFRPDPLTTMGTPHALK